MYVKKFVLGLSLLSLGALAADPALAGSPVYNDVRFITQGLQPAYSDARQQLAFVRFDPNVIGGPQLGSSASDGTGTFQLWISAPDGSNARCYSCTQVLGGPRANQHVSVPSWHPSGEWLIVAVEMPLHANTHASATGGTGAYVDLWAFAPDRNEWHQLSAYAPAALSTWFPDAPIGTLAPRLSRTGKHIAWAEMIGYDAQHPFGINQLAIADFSVQDGKPTLTNKRVSRPGLFLLDATFYEAQSFSSDDQWVTIASDSGPAHFGYLDVQLWHPRHNWLINLTRTIGEYEEQAMISPQDKRIVYMSTQGQNPRYDPLDFWGTFRTDLWVMNLRGTERRRLTWFGQPGAPEYLPGVNRAMPGSWTGDGNSMFFEVATNVGSHQPHEKARIYRIFLPN